jgi:hypothetical protein
MSYLLGADSERNPISGCATYRTDLLCDRIPGHMAKCLQELLYHTTYRDLNVGADITIQSLKSHGAYLATGEYVGTGLPVYQVYFETDTKCHDHMVRATSRKELRAALKLLYPHCNVGR